MRVLRHHPLLAIPALLVALGAAGCSNSHTNPPVLFGLTYPSPTRIYTRGVGVTGNAPVIAGGVATGFSVSPALPAGLSLAADGAVVGTPTAATATASYTITAQGPGGSASATLVITVNDPPPAGIQSLPNMGQQISPLAPVNARFQPLNPDLADNPAWLAGQAVSTVVSPDHKTLLVLTSGFNLVFDSQGSVNRPDSAEYVFVYDISTPVPVKKQVVKLPGTYSGIAFDPSGKAFYVSGGGGDCVYTLALDSLGVWTMQAPLALGHSINGVLTGNGLAVPPSSASTAINAQIGVKPCAAGLALSQDGATMVVANYFNDSVSVFTGGLGKWSLLKDLDLRPGKSDPAKAGLPGGSYPFWVSIKGSGATATAFVSSLRDREIIQVGLGASPKVLARIPVQGQPLKMTLNAAQSLLYVVEDQTDTVDVIDTASNAIVETIPLAPPASVLPAALAGYTGANPNSVTLSPDEKQLYVTQGNLNCVAVVALGGSNHGDAVIGLIPTGWYPTSTSFSGDGGTVYVVNSKSPTGANPGFFYSSGSIAGHARGLATNLYNPQLIKAGFQTFTRPDATELASLTTQVAANNRFASTESAGDAAVMAAVRKGIQHVIFIIKENRTYDQILGDLEVGNGDPDLALFGKALTPNQHALARSFTTLDSFLVTAEESMSGWPWTTSARSPDVIERQWPVAYAHRATSLDSEGLNRSVNVAIPTMAGRIAANPMTPADPDLLAGTNNVAAPDGPNHEINTGYLWDAALRAHLTVRNYGFFVDTSRYNVTDPAYSIAPDHDPFSLGKTVAYPDNISLTPFTDPYFRGFDNAFPDFYRYQEWAREFDTVYANTDLPALSLVRFMHDHTGDFGTAIDGVNTPETQVADNDYAVGLLLEKVSKSKYANNTLVFIIEDDSQDGPDHFDSHRTVAFVAGAYVKRGALVSTPYNTLDFVRTIEEVLGLKPMNMHDALAHPMADIFTTTAQPWTFTAVPAPILYSTQLPLPAQLASLVIPKPSHSARYWARATRGMDFEDEDKIDFGRYNRIFWKGLVGNRPYPARATGLDLRSNRAELLARAGSAKVRKTGRRIPVKPVHP